MEGGTTGTKVTEPVGITVVGARVKVVGAGVKVVGAAVKVDGANDGLSVGCPVGVAEVEDD